MANLLLLLLPLAALTHAAHITNCGSRAEVNLNEITVTGCDSSNRPCIFQKGRMASISLPFITKFQSSNVKAQVFGQIAGVDVPFPLDNPNACSGSGLTCPLVANEKYTYTAALPVKRIYPSISLSVKWMLKDDKETLVCILIPVKLQ